MVAPKAKPAIAKKTMFSSIGKAGSPSSQNSQAAVLAFFAVGCGGVGLADVAKTLNNIIATAKKGAFSFLINSSCLIQQASIK